MLTLSGSLRVFLALEPCDMRKSFDGLHTEVVNRLGDRKRLGAATAFDTFFLTVVLLVIATGVLAEVGRFLFSPALAVGIYVAHLGFILTLFLTFPYSKFAHLLYRTLAMVHERMRTSPGTERPI